MYPASAERLDRRERTGRQTGGEQGHASTAAADQGFGFACETLMIGMKLPMKEFHYNSSFENS
jgi:hypothetical protein